MKLPLTLKKATVEIMTILLNFAQVWKMQVNFLISLMFAGSLFDQVIFTSIKKLVPLKYLKEEGNLNKKKFKSFSFLIYYYYFFLIGIDYITNFHYSMPHYITHICFLCIIFKKIRDF